MHIASFKNMGSHAHIATCYHTSQLATCYRTSQVMLCFLPINLILNSQFWFTVCMYSSLIFCSLISALHQATRDSTSKQGLHYCCRTTGPKNENVLLITMSRNLLNIYVLVSICKNLRFSVIGLVYSY